MYKPGEEIFVVKFTIRGVAKAASTSVLTGIKFGSIGDARRWS